MVAIPKSVHADRLAQNLATDGFALDAGDMARIDAMDTGRPLILDVTDVREAYRLHGITFAQ